MVMRHLRKELWPHKVTIRIVQDPVAINDWLTNNMGPFRGQWNVVFFHDETVYYFKNEQDYVLFSLRWT